MNKCVHIFDIFSVRKEAPSVLYKGKPKEAKEANDFS